MQPAPTTRPTAAAAANLVAPPPAIRAVASAPPNAAGPAIKDRMSHKVTAMASIGPRLGRLSRVSLRVGLTAWSSAAKARPTVQVAPTRGPASARSDYHNLAGPLTRRSCAT